MTKLKELLRDYKLTDERYEELLRECSKKVNKESDKDWAEINEEFGLGLHPDSLRKSFSCITGGSCVREYYMDKIKDMEIQTCKSGSQENNKTANVDTNNTTYKKELEILKREIEKERKKLQTEKIEYNKWLREEARDEMIAEQVTKAIADLPPLEVPELLNTDMREKLHKSYLLAFGDAHYGIEFEIKNLFGETINAYSPEIFEKRMWELYNQVIDIVDKEHISELNVWELGDGIQGILRLNSQLMKLKYGIIDSSVIYANFLATWLNRLSKSVRIKFQMTMDSNHNQLRICNAPKNAFPEENMSKVMMSLIKERLKDNPNITIIENPTGMNWGLMSTYSVLATHGEEKSKNAIDQIQRSYDTHIDYLIQAHKHHNTETEVGTNSEVLGIRSIIGVDTYGMSLNKTSDAGATLFEFDQLKGLTCEHRLKFLS